MKNLDGDPGYVDADLQWANTILVMKEINRIQYLENFRTMAPQIVEELRKHGVVFPKESGK